MVRPRETKEDRRIRREFGLLSGTAAAGLAVTPLTIAFGPVGTAAGFGVGAATGLALSRRRRRAMRRRRRR